MTHRIDAAPGQAGAGRGRVTMREVAVAAGVSIKTVSNVLNDHPHVRPATRVAVETAIKDLGYRVNTSARNLRRGSTGVIGLALPELALSYFAELADAVMLAAEARGYAVLIEHTGAELDRELGVLTGPRRQQTDGVILSPVAMGPEHASALHIDTPIVLIGEVEFDAPVDHVAMSNVAAARAVTEHLIACGRRRIALLGVDAHPLPGSGTLRLRGYREALEAADLPFDERLLLPAPSWDRASGARAVAAAMDAGTEMDALFGLNDSLALGALHVLRERGVDVPRDVSVAGFDDVDEGAYSWPPLTTVSPGRLQIAQTSVGLLLDRIAGDASPHRRVLADFHLVPRASSTRAD